MPDARAVAEQILSLIRKANSIGVAAESAVSAFIAKLWPTFATHHIESGPVQQSAFASLPDELQADVLDAVDACKGE